MTASFEKLLYEQFSFLKYLAYNYTKDSSHAEDLFQATLERIVKNEASFRKDSNFKAWARMIMRNSFINDYRKAKSKIQFFESAKKRIMDTSADIVSNEGESNLDIAVIQKAIATLDERIKVPFLMHTQGFMYEEIAQKLDTPLGTVKSRIYMARKKLKEELKDFER